MRTAAIALLAALTTGCGKKPADPGPVAEPAVPAVPVVAPAAEPLEVWDVVKIELCTADGTRVEDDAGAEFVVMRRAEPKPVPEQPVAVGEIPPQPVEFSHKNHVDQLGIDCRYCHMAAAKDQAVPARIKTCMNCHQQIWQGAGLLKPGAAEKPGPEGKPAEVPKKERWRFVVVRDAAKTPKEIDATECDAEGRPLPGRAVRRGIYKEEGGTLLVALTLGETPKSFRPTEFKPSSLTKAGDRQYAGVAVFHLKKK